MKFEDMINKIILGDCMDYLKEIPDKSIDLVLTDPPYGIKADKGIGGNNLGKVRKYDDNWDMKTPDKKIFDELLRIGKKVIIFGGNYFTDKLPVNGHWLVWDKIGEINQKGVNFSSCELIYTNIPKNNVNKYFIRQIGFINDGDDRFHPTQKPYRLISEIMKDYSEENDLILDAFSGSGTVCCVAKDLKRKFIGFEINEKFYKKSIDRLNGIDSNGQYTIFAYENGDNK